MGEPVQESNEFPLPLFNPERDTAIAQRQALVERNRRLIELNDSYLRHLRKQLAINLVSSGKPEKAMPFLKVIGEDHIREVLGIELADGPIPSQPFADPDH